jgi:hypothetical protein
MRYGLKNFALCVALTGLANVLGLYDAHAMQYQRVALDPPGVVISARGPIIPGDYERFGGFLRTIPDTESIKGMSLDSPGGNIFEAEKIAMLVRRFDLSVVVTVGSECASACFLIFAAAPRRFMGADALIGIHSVSEHGEDTFGAMAFTTVMAREAAEFGVPAAIIGKLVATPPGRTTWLTPAELASMGVTVFEQQTTSTDRPITEAPQRGSPPAARLNSYSPGQEQRSAAYQEGTTDRRGWEGWFAGLAGAFKDGAEYWAEQRSTPRPGSCYGPEGENVGDWTAGCLAAKRILAPTDIRRKSEPDYRAGWNSL